MKKFESAIITSEGSLWEVWRASLRIRRNIFNRCVMVIAFLILLPYAAFSHQSAHELAELVRSWSTVGLGFAATILGFLVAGFTIFATLTKQDLLIAWAKLDEEHSGLPYLKYNFFAFFETFGWYVGFSALCLFVIVFCPSGGVLTQSLNSLPATWSPLWKSALARIAVIVSAEGFVLILLELKSFIFNIYHVVMTNIRWIVENEPPK